MISLVRPTICDTVPGGLEVLFRERGSKPLHSNLIEGQLREWFLRETGIRNGFQCVGGMFVGDW